MSLIKKKQTNKTNQLTLQSSPHDTRALVTEALLLVSLSFLRASVTIAALFLSHRTGSLLPLDLCWLFVLTEGCAHGSLPHLIPVAAEMPPFGEPVYLKYPFHLLFYYFALFFFLFCWDKVLLCSLLSCISACSALFSQVYNKVGIISYVHLLIGCMTGLLELSCRLAKFCLVYLSKWLLSSLHPHNLHLNSVMITCLDYFDILPPPTPTTTVW